jgi:hypothetical protein
MSTPATDDFDDLPPCVGERMRDVFHSIFAHQHAADIDQSTAQEKDHVHARD